MSHHYRQAIIIFGIALPSVAAAALIAIGLFAKSQMEASFENKLSSYKTYTIGQNATKEIENQVIKERPHLERWERLLSQETASTVTSNLREIIEHLPSKEIQQTAFDSSGSGGLGSATAQKSSQFRIALRGTYRSVQRAFLELETRMPQLQLQELRMDTTTGQSPLLNFQVSYTAWEK